MERKSLQLFNGKQHGSIPHHTVYMFEQRNGENIICIFACDA